MSDLIPSISLPGLLAERQAKIDAARAVLANPEASEFARFLVDRDGYGPISKEYVEDYIQQVERRSWREFIEASGLWDLFPRDMREQWGKSGRSFSSTAPCPFCATSTNYAAGGFQMVVAERVRW